MGVMWSNRLLFNHLPLFPCLPPQAAPLGPLSKAPSAPGRLLCAMVLAAIAGNPRACATLLEDAALAKAASEAVARAARDEDLSVSGVRGTGGVRESKGTESGGRLS